MSQRFAEAGRRTTFGVVAAQEELQQIETDPMAFLAASEDRDAMGPMVKLPDGSMVKAFRAFGDGCGTQSSVEAFPRWQPARRASTPLPRALGYAVVPWMQRQGIATQALRCLLPEAWAIGLRFVEITTDLDNVASQRVVEANGGVLVEEFISRPSSARSRGLDIASTGLKGVVNQTL